MNRFANHTRSTAFSLTLSQKMVSRMLRFGLMDEADAIMADLATRYDWYVPRSQRHLHCFAAPGADIEDVYLDGTDRALVRRGLLEVETGVEQIEEPPLYNGDKPEVIEKPWITIRLSDAGRVTVELLKIAEFEDPTPVTTYVSAVLRHPDDRLRVFLDPAKQDAYKQPRDRRLDLMEPGDERFFGDRHAIADKPAAVTEF